MPCFSHFLFRTESPSLALQAWMPSSGDRFLFGFTERKRSLLSKRASYIISDSIISYRESYLIFSFKVSTAVWITLLRPMRIPRFGGALTKATQAACQWFLTDPPTTDRAAELWGTNKAAKTSPCFYDIHGNTLINCQFSFFDRVQANPIRCPFYHLCNSSLQITAAQTVLAIKQPLFSETDFCTLMLGVRLSFHTCGTAHLFFSFTAFHSIF